MTRYIDAADHAKIIRKVLKEAFPGQKFSVRTSKYSGGASINVRWTDGPTGDTVNDTIKPLAGGYFDGMTDYKGGRSHMHNGEEISLGADFLFVHRDLSDEWIEAARRTWEKADGQVQCDFLNKGSFGERWQYKDEADMFARNVELVKAQTSKTAESYSPHRTW
jgi:hypothetical protein